jgi:hypothetical protein
VLDAIQSIQNYILKAVEFDAKLSNSFAAVKCMLEILVASGLADGNDILSLWKVLVDNIESFLETAYASRRQIALSINLFTKLNCPYMHTTYVDNIDIAWFGHGARGGILVLAGEEADNHWSCASGVDGLDCLWRWDNSAIDK